MAKIVDVCRSVVQGVHEYWGPVSPDAVSFDYAPDLNAVETAHTGRLILVGPLSAEQIATLTRGGDGTYEYGVQMAVSEYYTGTAGRPPDEWIDERMDFVDGLWRVFGDMKRSPVMNGLWPQTADVNPWYDSTRLWTLRHYFGIVEVRYRLNELR